MTAEMLFIIIRMHWKYKRILTTFKSVIFYCYGTFCNIKSFQMYTTDYFIQDYNLIRPKAVKHKLNISFHWGTCTLSFNAFSGEKRTLEHISNQAVHIWTFIFLIYLYSSEVLWYQVAFHVSWEFWNIKYPHLKY